MRNLTTSLPCDTASIYTFKSSHSSSLVNNQIGRIVFVLSLRGLKSDFLEEGDKCALNYIYFSTLLPLEPAFN